MFWSTMGQATPELRIPVLAAFPVRNALHHNFYQRPATPQ